MSSSLRCLPGVIAALGLWLTAFPGGISAQAPEGLEQWLTHAQAVFPRAAADCRDAKRIESVEKCCRQIDLAASRVGVLSPTLRLDDVLARVERLAIAQAHVDRSLDDVLALRKEFAKEKDPVQQRLMLRNYLRICNLLTDLSGRLRYQTEETIEEAAYRVASDQKARDRLLDLLAKYNNSVGAAVMSLLLFDPPADSANKALPATVPQKQRALQLIAQTGCSDTGPLLARYIREEKRHPDLVLAAADVLRRIGFPQDQRPGDTDPQGQPAITAAQLWDVLRQLPVKDARTAKLHQDLLQWSEQAKSKGLAGDRYRFATMEVQPGDWMLMRNPSPYHLVTDLAPGLFTHVGVVALEQGEDGKRRMVVVDLTTRGTTIRTTNVEALILQYRHYCFLRHPDPKAARTMADVAASIIGNEAVFDLNYRIDNVVALKGQPKRGKTITSYCAGLLLLCGQETPIDRSRLFPVSEQLDGAQITKNLKTLGITFGDQFVSPTGPLFSQEFSMVGRRLPLYDPALEVEDATYEHFAQCLRRQEVVPAGDPYQQARLTVAEAAKNNPALARLLGQLNNVNPGMDLVSAAKAAAMVEFIERAAEGNSRLFNDAFNALTSGTLEELKREGVPDNLIERFRKLRQQHADLYQQFQNDKIDLATLRRALVAHYTALGKAEIDKRFKTGG